jgi:hypothetical protein
VFHQVTNGFYAQPGQERSAIFSYAFEVLDILKKGIFFRHNSILTQRCSEMGTDVKEKII